MTDAARRHLDEVFVDQRPALLRMLTRLVGSFAAAEDLAHETYLRVSAALNERPIQYLEPFLFQSARNLALDHLRREKRVGKVVIDNADDGMVEAVAAAIPSPEAVVGDRQLVERLVAALATLSPRQRQILVLTRLDEVPQAAIAERLGVSISTVQKELKVALAACLAVYRRTVAQ